MIAKLKLITFFGFSSGIVFFSLLVELTLLITTLELSLTLTGVGVLELVLRFFELFVSFGSLFTIGSLSSSLGSFKGRVSLFVDTTLEFVVVSSTLALLLLFEDVAEVAVSLFEPLLPLWTVFGPEGVELFVDTLPVADFATDLLTPLDDFRLLVAGDVLDVFTAELFAGAAAASVSLSEFESDN